MKEDTKKRLKISIIGILISLIVLVILCYFNEPGEFSEVAVEYLVMRWGIYLLLVLIFCLVYYIFAGKRAFLYIFTILVVFETFIFGAMIASRYSADFALVIIGLAIFTLLAFMVVRDYKNVKSAMTSNETTTASDKEIEQEVQQILNDEVQFREKIKYLEKSIIVVGSYDRIYQLIKTYDAYYFHYVGNVLKGINESKLITQFEDIDTSIEDKKSFSIPTSEVENVTCSTYSSSEVFCWGKLVFRKAKGSKTFRLINSFTDEELSQFFETNISIVNKHTEPVQKEDLSKEDLRQLQKFNLFTLIYGLISGAVLASFFVMPYSIARMILLPLCLIALIIPIVLSAKYPKYFYWNNSNYWGTAIECRIPILNTAMMFALFLMIDTLLRLQYLVYIDWVMLLIMIAVIFVVLTTVILLLYKSVKKRKSTIPAVILFLLLVSGMIVCELNNTYTIDGPIEVQSSIVDKPTWTNNNGEVTYYLLVDYNDTEIKFEVSKETFDSYTFGDFIPVIECTGLLGIQYATVDKSI